MSWKTLGEGIDRGVEIIHQLIPETNLVSDPSSDPIVVAFLSATGTDIFYINMHSNQKFDKCPQIH